MTHHFIAHDAKGYVVYRLVNGLYRLNVGPYFPTPRAAMAYSDQLDAAQGVSPLPATRSGPHDPPREALSGSPVGSLPRSSRA